MESAPGKSTRGVNLTGRVGKFSEALTPSASSALSEKFAVEGRDLRIRFRP